MESIKRNIKYTIIQKLVMVLIPLLTVPYVSRVLGPTANGLYSYTNSIVSYFLLFAMLGTINYGSRRIAKVRENKEALSKEFCSIYCMQFIVSVLVMIAYILYVVIVNLENESIYLLQMIYLISAFFDISWYFNGIENFKVTSKINVIIKVISTACIFIFVKSPANLGIYTLIVSLNILLSQVALWRYVSKEINIQKPEPKMVWVHFKKSVILFIPILALNIYKMSDKIIVGNICGMEEVGFYNYAQKIIDMPTALILILGTVMLPHMSNLISNNNEEQVKKYLGKSIDLILFLTIPMAIGIYAIAQKVTPLFLGSEYIQTGILLKYLSITLVTYSISNIIRTQYLIPKEKDIQFVGVLTFGAVVNIILNFALIPKYRAIGAVIATVITELCVFIAQIIIIKNELNVKKYIKNFIKFFAKGLIMYLAIVLVEKIIKDELVLIIVQIIIGGIIYLSLNYKYIRQLINMSVKNKG